MDNLKIKIDRCFLLSFHFFEFYKYGQIGLLIPHFMGISRIMGQNAPSMRKRVASISTSVKRKVMIFTTKVKNPT